MYVSPVNNVINAYTSVFAFAIDVMDLGMISALCQGRVEDMIDVNWKEPQESFASGSVYRYSKVFIISLSKSP